MGYCLLCDVCSTVINKREGYVVFKKHKLIQTAPDGDDFLHKDKEYVCSSCYNKLKELVNKG